MRSGGARGARLARLEGESELAERLARAGVRAGEKSGNTDVITMVRLELARALDDLGRLDEARAEALKALALYESKGDRPGMAEVQAFLDQVRGAPG